MQLNYSGRSPSCCTMVKAVVVVSVVVAVVVAVVVVGVVVVDVGASRTTAAQV